MVEVKGSDAAKRKSCLKAKGFDTGLPLRGCVVSSSDPVLPAQAALVNFVGEDIAVKAPHLSVSYIGGRQALVEHPDPLHKSTLHTRLGLIHGGKKAKMSAE